MADGKEKKGGLELAKGLAKKAGQTGAGLAVKAKNSAAHTAEKIGDKTAGLRTTVATIKEDVNEKLTELDRMLEQSITDYNDAYTTMNDRGLSLYIERTRAVDIIELTENLVNSIANKPKEFDSDFEEISMNKAKFVDSCEFANKELQIAREAAGSAGVGVAAGATVAFMAPSAAMWVATTFGTASTGVAISSLTGAAATNAALAWLGGGALTAGGGGMVAGNALLALSGPIGWGLAGASLLSTIVVFSKKRSKLNSEKNEEIEAVKHNTELVKEADAKIKQIFDKTLELRALVIKVYKDSVSVYGKDYSDVTAEEKQNLMLLINNTKALSAQFAETVE